MTPGVWIGACDPLSAPLSDLDAGGHTQPAPRDRIAVRGAYPTAPFHR